MKEKPMSLDSALLPKLGYGDTFSNIAQYVVNSVEAFGNNKATIEIKMFRATKHTSYADFDGQRIVRIRDYSPNPIEEKDLRKRGISSKVGKLGRFGIGINNAVSGNDPLATKVVFATGDTRYLVYNKQVKGVLKPFLGIEQGVSPSISPGTRCDIYCTKNREGEIGGYSDLRDDFSVYFAPLLRAGNVLDLEIGGEMVEAPKLPSDLVKIRKGRSFRGKLWKDPDAIIRWYWKGTLIWTQRTYKYDVSGEVYVTDSYGERYLDFDPAKVLLPSYYQKLRQKLEKEMRKHFKPTIIRPSAIHKDLRDILRTCRNIFKFPGTRKKVPHPGKRAKKKGKKSKKKPKPPTTVVDRGEKRPTFVHEDGVRVNGTSKLIKKCQQSSTFYRKMQPVLYYLCMDALETQKEGPKDVDKVDDRTVQVEKRYLKVI